MTLAERMIEEGVKDITAGHITLREIVTNLTMQIKAMAAHISEIGATEGAPIVTNYDTLVAVRDGLVARLT
jgi:hypothetical protein